MSAIGNSRNRFGRERIWRRPGPRAGVALAAAAVAVSTVWWLAARPAQAKPATAKAPAATGAVDYARDIQPLFAKHCYECHGPAKHKGGLRLDSRTHAFQAADSGEKPIVPGDAADSHVLKLVRGDDPDMVMPPEGKTRLSPQEIDLLTRWINAGATWPDGGGALKTVKHPHWAFSAPVRPKPPAVKNAGWVRNSIDHFVLARLEKEGLSPAPEADRYTLIRRAYIDLIGLPPTPLEADQFANDRRPDAYERMVDRLMANPHFGERWARVWMDMARYADSSGYGSDPLRFTSWRYRDWVIEAFNKNQPYDRFTVEQIAGDLLPNPTPDQLIATGFHRNTQTNTEGGTDDEEWRVASVKDRATVTMQVWMGLTLQCAECHTHKYDPLTNREYYQFYSFFNNTEDNDQPDESPTIEVPSVQHQAQLAKIDAEVAKVKAEMDDPAKLAAGLAEWEKSALESESGWVRLEPTKATANSGATLKPQRDGSVLAAGPRAQTDTYTVVAPTQLKGITAFRLDVLPDASLPAGGPGRADNGNFVLTDFRVTAAPRPAAAKAVRGRFVRIELAGNPKILHLAEVQVFRGSENIAPKGTATQSSTAFDGAAGRAIDGNTDGRYFEAKSTSHTAEGADPWWEVDLGQSAAGVINKIALWSRTDAPLQHRLNGMKVSVLGEDRKPVWDTIVPVAPQTSLELEPGGPAVVPLAGASDTHHQPETEWAAAGSIDADAGRSGWAVGPQFGKPHSAVFETGGPVGHDGGTVLTFTLTHNYPDHPLGKFRLLATTKPRPVGVLPAQIAAALNTPATRRTDAQKAELTEYYKSVAPQLATARERLAALQNERNAVKPVRQAIMRELPADKRRVTNVLIKGNFLSKGDVVTPAVPAALHSLPKDAPADRLGLANWLVDANNPLTARVAVNRWWSAIFGLGLVETQEDFGTQGQPPSHPQLLDWLATEYLRLKWDTKALLKTIVTSATYRQSSRQTPELVEKDPYNRLYARGPRGRLEAELVRDQALALSGLLSKKMHGPSVYPPQPPNLWQAAFNGERTYPTSEGEDKYRRGLYTFWRRTVPYPSMAAFDAPSRETCTLRRIHTSTPLQAFVTLNDPVYVEAAQALARRIVTEGGATPEDRIRFALKLCLLRPPTAEQVSTLVGLYQSELKHYQADKAAAQPMATDPLGPLPAGMDVSEMAAWTVVSNVLLNLDGVLTKG